MNQNTDVFLNSRAEILQMGCSHQVILHLVNYRYKMISGSPLSHIAEKRIISLHVNETPMRDMYRL